MTNPLSDEMRDLLALQLIPGIGPRLTAALLHRFGSAGAARRASAEELCQVPHIGKTLAQKMATMLSGVDVDAELARMAQHQVNFLMANTPEYPASLAEISDSPQLLYCRGQITAADSRAVAIVGSRHCTSYGKRMAERLAADLAGRGYTIVSGLARGIDGAAHRGALQAGGRTLAVLAGGLARIYPPEHKELADQVAAAGALLSEAAMIQEPLPNTFPVRNRIISGLSRAVVIVEAAQRSGALITAKHAAEQGRSVFAVPGPVDSAASAGTNGLIREGAVLCRGAHDVLEELDGLSGMQDPAPAPKELPPLTLDATERALWEMLGGEPKNLDDVAQALGLSIPKLSGILLTLEMKRIVRRLPGNRYEQA